ncbi:MAG: hypothetical protein KGZ56_09935, partial [Dethiobacter sp.]|nr:hypothetical protein [Dethiobacter sp.]MBS3898248.1 hypothetical protein [Dethiobacter sp.]
TAGVCFEFAHQSITPSCAVSAVIIIIQKTFRFSQGTTLTKTWAKDEIGLNLAALTFKLPRLSVSLPCEHKNIQPPFRKATADNQPILISYL